MRKIFFVEGIPGAGKTSLLVALSSKYLIIPEVIDDNQLLEKHNQTSQDFFLINDEKKLKMAEKSTTTCIVDRSPLSTVFFNIAKFSLDIDHPIAEIMDWYGKKIRPVLFDRDSLFRFIYIDIDPMESLDRKQSEEIIADPWRNIQSLSLIRSMYYSLSKKYPEQVFVVDEKLEPGQLMEMVDEYIQSC